MAPKAGQRISLWQIWRQAEPYQRRNATLGGVVFLWAGLLYVGMLARAHEALLVSV